MSEARFIKHFHVNGSNTALNFYKHDTVHESYYCIIGTQGNDLIGTYTMRQDPAADGSWHFEEHNIPDDLKEAEAEISDLINENESDHPENSDDRIEPAA